MRISIVGAGGMGATLARLLAARGHDVSIASARGPQKLAALANEVGATPVSVADAANQRDVVFLAIPTKAVPQLPRELFAEVRRDVIVVDLGNYHPELRDGRIDAIENGLLDSQWVSQQIGQPVIKAFNTIFAASLLQKGAPPGTPGRVALPVAGDSPVARATLLHVVDELGFDPVDAGTLADSWRQATGTPAYCRDLDATALQRALAAADHTRIADYRTQEEARIKRSLAR